MIVYAMALPERYDVACGAYAFALVVTLAATGGYTTGMLLSRAWETVLRRRLRFPGGARALANPAGRGQSLNSEVSPPQRQTGHRWGWTKVNSMAGLDSLVPDRS